MPQLAATSLYPATAPSARWAHDIRNALSTVGLHLERLERLSGSRGREIAHAAHTLMSRAAAMCSDAMAPGANGEGPSRRRGLDLVKTAELVADLLRPAAPEGFEIGIAASGTFNVLADPQDVFRILFNLVHNAVSVARQSHEGGACMTQVKMLIERAGPAVTIRVADDGPGLPDTVRSNLFRPQASRAGGGVGLSIARELAERNGGMLRLIESERGATFLLQLTAITGTSVHESGALRSLGKRAPH